MATAPPVADTKKPAPQPPEKKDGKAAAGGGKDAAKAGAGKQDGGAQKAGAVPGKAEGKSAQGAGGDKAAAQQRVDRMAVRAKLSVSEPGDAVEKEADQVAEKVTQRLGDPKAQAGGAAGVGASPGSGEPLQVQRRPAGVMREAAPASTEQSDQQQIKGRSGAADPQQRLKAQAGLGPAIPGPLRSKLEGQFGQDLSAVRLHTDTEADALARDYRAEAFTVGNDIYFASGRYQPDTPAGLNLLAHELTHVVQQGAPAAAPGQAVGRQVMRKPTPAATAPSSGSAGSATAGVVDHAGKTITIPVLNIPSYKRKADAIGTSAQLPAKYERPGNQRHVWGKGILETGGYADAVKNNINTKRGKKSAKTGKMIHVIKPKASDTYFIGDVDSLPAKVALPRWNKDGAHSLYDVDHKKEMQLDGTNTLPNMEMLDASANRSSGSRISKEIRTKLNAAILPEVGPGKHWPKAPDLNQVKSAYTVKFTSTAPTLDVAGNPENHWSVEAVTTGAHMKPMETLTAAQIDARSLIGDETHLVIYPRVSGGSAQTVGWNNGAPTSIPKDMFTNFEIKKISYSPGAGGTIDGIKSFKKDLLRKEPVTWRLTEMEGMDYTVFVDRASVEQSLLKLELPGASPVTFREVDLDDRGAVAASGTLNPTLPLLGGLSLDLNVSNDQVWLSKTFDGPELQFPGPVQVMASTLTLSAGTGGLKVEGDVDYEITKLGKGRISGLGAFGAGSGASFGIKGSFELDKSVFDGEARIEAGYENEAFWAKGHLSIADGKVKGIQSASIDAAFEKGAFTATGTVVPKIPAVESASLSIAYSEAAGLKFSGDLGFKNNPLISGGKLHIEAAQPPGGEGFKVKGNGSATPNIPGIKSELTADYDDGALNANFSGAYAKGMLSGQISVGVTNRSVDEQGNLGALADPNAPLVVYGSGSATLRIAPWLQGTAGIKFSPTGEVTVSGDIGLPGDLQLFARQEINKSLFSLSTQIPIVPGIVAEVGGNLSAKAGIGPGVLDQLRIHVDYNPAHEENTHVTGDAHLNVPADAGLRLAARAGIGLGITGASATGGIELGGSLGIDGAAEAGVHVDWMPSQGLRIDANAAFHAEPKFKFDVSGYVAVTALGFSVYDQRWQLAAYELGSNMRFGVNFPVHYVEGQPFSVSMSDVEFEVPDVDPGALIGQLGAQIF